MGGSWTEDGACTADPCPRCATDADCNDLNVCTVDSCADGICRHAPTDNSCDDGFFCTAADTCVGGACIGTGDPCPGTVCYEVGDACVECLVNAQCDDKNPCTTDACGAASHTCQHGTQLTDPCDDGQFCTVDDHCRNGLCTGEPFPCTAGAVCDEEQDLCV